MIFQSLTLKDGTITATATGHPSEVVTAFHAVCQILLSSRGPWRITEVNGSCPDEFTLDSEMGWGLIAKSK